MRENTILNDTPLNIRRAGVIFLVCFSGLLIVIATTAVMVMAATSAKTNSADGFADRNEITRTVTFSGADFSPGAQVSDLTLEIIIEKIDDSCGNYLSTNVFNREIYMLLSSPLGTEIVLVENVFNDGGSGNGGTFTSNSVYNGVVTIVFDDAASSQVGGPAPASGSFRPEQPLAAFLGEDPVGDWTLTLGDHTNGAPLCFDEMTLTLDADQPPNMDDQTFAVAEGSPNGSFVDTVIVTDEDPDDKFTFMEIGGSGLAVFEIDTATGVISVTDSTKLDFETPALSQYTYIVEVTDSGALTDSATITINVTDGNDAPTDLALAPASVVEHQPSGTTVGSLSSTDQDSGDSHLYTLVSGTGDDDNSQFTIAGSTVKTAAEFDFDVKNSYTVRVQSNDQHGGLFAKAITITITDGNDPPTDISLSSSTIQENQPISSTVGLLSASDPNSDVPTYQLVSGLGDDDNGSFDIVGSELKSLASFDFEGSQITYTVRIEADDGNGGLFEKAFTISVTNVDDAATNFSLSNSTITESLAINTPVGTFTAVDVDGGTYTYTLAAGSGDSDNGNFVIVGDELQTAVILDYESQITHTIRVKLADGVGTIEKNFIITVIDENEDPTDITLSSSSVLEHQPADTVVGSLSATDSDSGDVHTFSLVIGSGDTDNGLFQIVAGQLETAAELDYDVQTTRTVRIEANDGHGGTFQKAFTITVLDGNDPPSDITLDNTTLPENQAIGTAVGNLGAIDPNGDSPITFTLPLSPPDNSFFQIVGLELQSAVSFDHESDDTFNIIIEADDGKGGYYQEPFTITISDNNDTPTSIGVSPDSVQENQPISTTVGTLTATDQDADSHTFSLVAGSGDTHNSLFDIVGTALKTNFVFDYETALSSYSIRVETNDGFGGIYTQTLAITIDDANDDPTGITLDNATVEENLPIGSEVGAFSTIDEDSGDSFTYSLVAGSGDIDNGLFQIVDEVLETKASFDFESAPLTYTVRVQTFDGSTTFAQPFIITITDGNDAPHALPDNGGTTDEDTLLTVLTADGVLKNDTDEDVADLLTVTGYDLLSAQNGFVAVAGSGSFTYDPRASTAAQALRNGEILVDSFTYIVQDSGGLTDTATVTVTITGVNDAPTAVNDAIFTNENTDVIIAVLGNDSDPEDDTITITTHTTPANGTVINNGNGTLTYAPNTDFIGQDTFTYSVEDGEGGSATAQVTVSVGQTKVYLPLLLGSYKPAPDLVITNIQATANEIRVEIQNQGDAATVTGFWVDFYIDPDPIPTEVEEIWQDIASEGLVWGVTKGLAPNETLTLIYSTATHAPNLYFSASNSAFSGVLPEGTAVYAQVDSAHLNTTYGGILENHEINNGAYNNVSSLYLATATLRPVFQSIE